MTQWMVDIFNNKLVDCNFFVGVYLHTNGNISGDLIGNLNHINLYFTLFLCLTKISAISTNNKQPMKIFFNPYFLQALVSQGSEQDYDKPVTGSVTAYSTNERFEITSSSYT